MIALREKRPPHAVVIGLDCMTGLQTARILARHAIPVLGIASDRSNAFCRTNVCERILYTDLAGDELLETLAVLGPTLPNRAVVYPCADNTVLLLSRRRDELKAWYHIILPEAEVLELLLDKISFCIYAQNNGLPIPVTCFLRDRADAERAAKELRFPCILKPPMRTAKWEKSGAKKVYRLAGPAELLSVYDANAANADVLMVQEWVPGTDADLYSCNCYLNAKSEPLVAFVARKIRQWPPEAGVSSLGVECRNDTVLHTTLDLFRRTGHRGLGYLEMKRNPVSGEHFIIEPNVGRPTGRSAIAEAGGVDLLYTMYCDALGWPLPDKREQRYTGVKWMYFRRDLQSAFYYWRKRELTIAEWLRSMQGPKVDAVFSWKDPAPFVHDLKDACRKMVVAARNGSSTSDATQKRLAAREQHNCLVSAVDFDVHGAVGVRLINASRADIAAVRRQLGPLEAKLTRKPDITLLFREALLADDFRDVELGTSGFCNQSFMVVKSGRPDVKVGIPFEDVGRECEIVCETGLESVPLLMAVVNLTALNKRYVPLHASAFVHQGTGVLVTGWSKGGKTEALLAFASHGATYVGDEWILLAQNGEGMCGIPERIRLWDWHLDQVQRLKKKVPLRKKVAFGCIHSLERAERLGLSFLRPAMPGLKRQLNVQLAPEAIFGNAMTTFSARPDKVFLMANWHRSEVVVEPADPDLLAQRMSWSNRYELMPLWAEYNAFRFAFPDKRNHFIERALELQEDLLRSALAQKECYTVWHPYPARLHDLYAAMVPMVESKNSPTLGRAVDTSVA